ncbi:diguanylate cyclase domain-containing protein [Marinobacter sp. M1N3S26]|uniref:diguanylate cyclase domain-containing protein n=1 Tax=unclassified Marinobacter TaxID=83889 RepID=UPI00387B71AC
MAGNGFKGELEKNLGILLNASPDCILVCDVRTLQYVYVNQTTCDMTGYSREELLAMTAPDLTGQPPEYTREVYRNAMQAGDRGYTDEPRLLVNKTRSRRGWWEAHFRYREIDGQEVVVIVSREVTRRMLAEQAATRIRKIYAALSATNEAIMRLSSRDELFQAVCDAAIDSGGMTTAALLMPKPGSDLLEMKAMAGYGREVLEDTVISIDPEKPEGRGLNGNAFRTCEPCVSNDYFRDRRTDPWHRQMRSRTLLKAVASVPIVLDGKAVGTLHLCSRERNAFDEEIVGLLMRMADNIAFALRTIENEQERREAEKKAHYLATHCGLTGLPNRNLLSDLLGQAIASVDRTGHHPALMFVDLDNFKDINDTWGHDMGDQVLEQVADRLRGVLREHDVLARLGGDEFVVLVQNIDRREHAVTVAEKLLAAVKESILVEGRALSVTLSIGISLYPDHGKDQKALMKAADMAMYQAKDKGKNAWAISGDRGLSNSG